VKGFTAWACLACALAMPMFACAQADTYYEEDPKRWGTPDRILLPDYPPGALKAGQTGYVDFEGAVGPLRELGDAKYAADSLASEVFVEALKDVLPRWSFFPPLDMCMPAKVRVKNRIWFELDNGKPRIFLSRGSSGVKERADTKPLRRIEPKYPVEALRAGWAAYTYSRLDVGPDGAVTDVTTQAFSNSSDAHRVFEAANRSAFMRWQFEAGKVRRACMEVFYRLRN
jgi:hypothetical protein